mmetsp:Transcript_22186/g.44323  ORF Transcript_22186/g.44323 Transcript_22186/m.44323 type:complete len:91 (-) Transcript_22186:80-352(-)
MKIYLSKGCSRKVRVLTRIYFASEHAPSIWRPTLGLVESSLIYISSTARTGRNLMNNIPLPLLIFIAYLLWSYAIASSLRKVSIPIIESI